MAATAEMAAFGRKSITTPMKVIGLNVTTQRDAFGMRATILTIYKLKSYSSS